MDFAQSALLIAAIYTVMKVLNEAGLAKLSAPVAGVVKPLVALAVGVGAVFLVASSVWAHDQVIAGRALDTLNDSSKVLAGILAGAGAVGLDTVFKTVRNVGENDPTT